MTASASAGKILSGVFVTGTDTDVGKTLVLAILAKAWGADYWKPYQTGVESAPGDTETVAALLGPGTPGHCPGQGGRPRPRRQGAARRQGGGRALPRQRQPARRGLQEAGEEGGVRLGQEGGEGGGGAGGEAGGQASQGVHGGGKEVR